MDNKYLKRKGNIWYFQKRVTKKLRQHYPNVEIIEISLKTGDIRKARQHRDIILGQIRTIEANFSSQQKSPRQKYLAYVDHLTAVKNSEVIGDLTWEDIADPISAKKEDDLEYIEAYRTVANENYIPDAFVITLKELLQNFLEYSKRENLHTPGTLNRYQDSVNRFLNYTNKSSDIGLNKISKKAVISFIDFLRGTLSTATVHGHISRLKTLWNFAHSRDEISGDNPFSGHQIKTTKSSNKKQPFTTSELKEILNRVTDQTLSFKLLVCLGIYTGARISELVAIEKEHIQEEDGITFIHIAPNDSGKTKSATRLLPVPDACINDLISLTHQKEGKQSKYLFFDLVSIRPDGRIGYYATKKFGDFKKRFITKEKNKGFHSFRVMMATHLQRAHVPEHVAAALLGHSRGTTMSYGYYSRGYDIKQLKQAINDAEQIINEELSEMPKHN